MTQEKINLNLQNILGSSLESFGIVSQFIELTFSGEIYEEIKFFIDCDIISNDDKINESKRFFDSMDKDVSSIIYFIKANRQKIMDVSLKEQSLSLVFSNGYIISFLLNKGFEEPLNITFKENIDLEIVSKMIFDNNGMVQ